MPKLEKALIVPLNGKNRAPIPVLFNPAEYSIERSNVYQANAAPGMPLPLLQFVGGNAQTLTMELFFDTYTDGDRRDVRLHTALIVELARMDASLHAPPFVRFVWGRSLLFQAVIERVTQKFTMFLGDGTPVRATLSVTFREYKTIEEQLADPPLESSDLEKRHTVVQGDSLWAIAHVEYGDPADWRLIAEANGLENPRLLEPASVLRLPPRPQREAGRARDA
jgi:hypothetical protein